MEFRSHISFLFLRHPSKLVSERVERMRAGRETFRSKSAILKHRNNVSRCFLPKSIKKLGPELPNSDISSLQVYWCFELDFFQPASNLYCKISGFARCLTTYSQDARKLSNPLVSPKGTNFKNVLRTTI